MKIKNIFLIFFILACSTTQKEVLFTGTPSAILQEAVADTKALRYEIALQKFVWLFKHGLEADKNFYGVRLSFVLGDWVELGNLYPAATTKLIQIRDEREAIAKEASDDEAFIDVNSINRYLKDETRTLELFKWLDVHQPAYAKKIYKEAQSSLVKFKRYNLCRKYLRPEKRFQELTHIYQKPLPELAADKDYLQSIEDNYVENVSEIITILIKTGAGLEGRAMQENANSILKATGKTKLQEKLKNL